MKGLWSLLSLEGPLCNVANVIWARGVLERNLQPVIRILFSGKYL